MLVGKLNLRKGEIVFVWGAQKSFLFLLEEKIWRAQIRKSEENFFAGWRALASGGVAASFVRVRLVKSSDFIQETQPTRIRLKGYGENRVKTKTPLAGVLAKQICVGYSLIDVIAKAYSHSFAGSIASLLGKAIESLLQLISTPKS